MITGERNYERVVSACELTPNDYILKPLNAETLRVRLLRALQERPSSRRGSWQGWATRSVQSIIAALRAMRTLNT